MATCKEAFAEREDLTKHVENEHTKSEPSSRPEPRSHLVAKSESAANSFTCYFEGCDQSFEAADKLNEHLIIQHNMLYKDIEARSKMNLLFLEQFKHQMAEQYAAVAAGGHSEMLSHVGPFSPPPSQLSAAAVAVAAHHSATTRFPVKSESHVNINLTL